MVFVTSRDSSNFGPSFNKLETRLSAKGLPRSQGLSSRSALFVGLSLSELVHTL